MSLEKKKDEELTAKGKMLVSLQYAAIPLALFAGTLWFMTSRDVTVYGAQSTGLSPELVNAIIGAIIALLGGVVQSPVLDFLKKLFPTTGTVPTDFSSLEAKFKEMLNEVGGLTPQEKVMFKQMSSDIAEMKAKFPVNQPTPPVV